MAKPYGFLRWTFLPILRSRIWTIQGVENLPREGGFILTPNHQSWIDSAILASAIYRRLRKPLKFIAQSNKYGMFGGLPIESTDRRHVLDVAQNYLNAGYPVVIFPEGNSNTEVELRMGKTGAARLALRSGLPVVPVGIKGTKGVRAWASLIWFFTLVRPCHLVIGQPVSFQRTDVEEYDPELLRTTTETIMHHISDLSGKLMPGEGPALGRRGFIWYFLWRFFRPLIQWRFRIKGKEYLPRTGPFIVVGNHASYFDAPALASSVFHVTGLQPMFLTKASVAAAFRRWFGRSMVDALGYLPLDNTDRSKVLHPAIQHLQQGGVLGVFPEGTRNKPSLNPNWKTTMLRGKTGAARLVIATGAPVIPVAIQAPKAIGIFEGVVKSLLPWNFTRLTFGPPITFSHVPLDLDSSTKSDLNAMTTTIMHQLAAMNSMDYPY